jgi:hypothetical protein
VKNEIGEIAMEIIADHPLYASTSGITYEEAIAIAQIVTGEKDLKAYKAEMDRFDSLPLEEQKKELGIK